MPAGESLRTKLDPLQNRLLATLVAHNYLGAVSLIPFFAFRSLKVPLAGIRLDERAFAHYEPLTYCRDFAGAFARLQTEDDLEGGVAFDRCNFFLDCLTSAPLGQIEVIA